MRRFCILEHIILPTLIALYFDLAAQNLWTAVLGLTSNVYKSQPSDFLALVFFIFNIGWVTLDCFQ